MLSDEQALSIADKWMGMKKRRELTQRCMREILAKKVSNSEKTDDSDFLDTDELDMHHFLL